MTNGRKPHRRQTLMIWLKSKGRRPGMLKVASFTLNIINLVARFIDWIQ